MSRFLKSIIWIVLPISVFAQSTKSPEYVSLSDNSVYDIEIIVFAYKTALPNAETYTNKPLVNLSETYELLKKKANQPYLRNTSDKQSVDNYTIAIDGKKEGLEALVWFEHNASDFQLSAFWNKLKGSADIKPLIHRAWRQPETPFESPQYINISTVNVSGTIYSPDEVSFPNYSILGKVALSKGRYTHFGNKINLIRSNQNAKNMVFDLTERKQIKKDELHYFDSPWLGAIVKISKYTGETSNE